MQYLLSNCRNGIIILSTFSVIIVLMHCIIMHCLMCLYGGRCGHDHMVVGFTTTYAIRAYHH
jgi:hypothetical protein